MKRPHAMAILGAEKGDVLANSDLVADLASLVQRGLNVKESEPAKPLLEQLFNDGRYHKRHLKDVSIRDRYGLQEQDDKGVPFAALINANNPSTGRYGGASFVWFPTKEHGSLIGLGVGSQGISPDEGILARHGHRRRVRSLRALISEHGVECWSKSDPAALDFKVPDSVVRHFAPFENALKRYASEMYCFAALKPDTPPEKARFVLQAFLDLYAFERGWNVLNSHQRENDKLLASLKSRYFEHPTSERIHQLLKQRRFVVLQGPPGTGKTRFTEQVAREFFASRAMTVQFHPSVTYEDFIVGLSPEPTAQGLHFNVKPGWLMQAVQQAKERPFLLVIDEINRADLGRVLGEAVYLFEADEIGQPQAREVALAHEVNGSRKLRLPANLYVLATMNTADRSISRMDLAIRRRFAFVSVPPNPAPIEQAALSLASDAFTRIQEVFIEHANDDVLDLMPGHAYFLAKNESELRVRLQHALVPLIDEYLQQGLMGSAHGELQTVRDWLQDRLAEHA